MRERLDFEIPRHGKEILLESGKLQEGQRHDMVMPVQKRYKLVSREAHPANSHIRLPEGQVIGGPQFQVMAGPCSVESENQLMEVAVAVKEAFCVQRSIP